MAHLLLINDNPELLPEKVRQFSPAPRHRVAVAYTGAEGLGRVATVPPGAILLEAIGRVADQSLPVVITGESGTGKEFVARANYQHGPRARVLNRCWTSGLLGIGVVC